MQQQSPSDPAAPELSVILVTPDNYESIRRAVRYVGAQSARARIEIVIVAPSAETLGEDPNDLSTFGQHRIVEVGSVETVARANAAGVRAASAPLIAFVEEHSFPQPGWAEALIEAQKHPWAAVGPMVLNANPWSAVSWADYLTAYGKWAGPEAGGEIDFLPGHNSSYKRDILLAYGDRLESMLEAESVLHWDLRANGHRLYLEPAAKVSHVNFSRLATWIRVQHCNGLVFAAARARSWPLLRRLLYAGGSPLIPFVRLWRILSGLRSAGLPRLVLLRTLPALVLGLTLDAAGQMLGYAFGAGEAASNKLGAFEFHRFDHITAHDRAALAEQEAALTRELQ